MQSLFNIVASVSQGTVGLPAEWIYLKQGLRKNLSTVIRYYRSNPMAVPSNHFLVRLLQSITVPQSQNLERYYDNVDTISLNLSMALKMTSSIFKGTIFKGTFYGEGNDEILIANNESFDIYEAHDNWQNLTPVKVFRCPRSDLGFNIPDGTDTGSETGLAVININIPMLAIQYRAFRLNEIALTEKGTYMGDSQKSLMQFIHMYVLPNMLVSQLDQIIFNRIANLEKGAPLGESSRRHSFYLTDYSSKLNKVQNVLLDNLKKVGKDFSGVLHTVPMVCETTAYDIIGFPDMALTRQCIWGLVIGTLPTMSFLFRVSAGEKNQTEINRIMRSMLSYKSDNLMRSMLPIDLYKDVQDEINEIASYTKIKI